MNAPYDKPDPALAEWTDAQLKYELKQRTISARPERVCSKCGIKEGDTEWGSLIDIEVRTARGEEGDASVTMLLCDQCFPVIQEAVKALGFVDHHHGGIDFLEDESCGGWGKCPTAHHFGAIVIGNPYYNEAEPQTWDASD